MPGKKSKLYAIFTNKCPRCHEGDLFEHPPYILKSINKMPDACPKCSQPFHPEPGFYYGAMFLSYIVTAWFCLGVAAFLVWVIGLSINTAFAILIGICLVLFVPFFRFARSLWINMVVKFDPAAQKNGAQPLSRPKT